MLKLPRLSSRVPIVDPKTGLPTNAFVRFNQDTAKAIEAQDAEQQAQIDAIFRTFRAVSHADGLVITSTADGATASVTISTHTRVYLDKAVTVTGGTLTGLAYDTFYSVYYDDPDRSGGAVTFVATINPTQAVTSDANPNRQLVGSVKTPANSSAPPSPGGGTVPPGWPGGDYQYNEP